MLCLRPASRTTARFSRKDIGCGQLRSHSTSSAAGKSKPPSVQPGSIKFQKILLLGAPGVGKGTYAKVIHQTFGFPHLSSGDFVRHELRSSTPLALRMRSFYDKGELIPDDLISELMRQKIGELESDTFIIDGFPRTQAQVAVLDDILRNHIARRSSKQGAKSSIPAAPKDRTLDLVINFQLSRDILVEKICARRVCKKCGNNYNIASIHIPEKGIHMPPLLPKKKEGHCDTCDIPLVQRDDDKEDIVRHRLHIYDEQTQPLEQIYRKRGLLLEVDVSAGRDGVAPVLVDMLTRSDLLEKNRS